MPEIIDWLSGPDPVFAFPLALPFIVGSAEPAVASRMPAADQKKG